MTNCTLRPWTEVAARCDALAQLRAIFFDASNTRSFADDAAREAFFERWLGRYLAHYADVVFVAMTDTGEVLGYVCGCMNDPAKLPRFADIALYQTFADLTLAYPAHLHVNLRADARGAGLGAQLVGRFLDAARGAGAVGAHVMTGADARNVRFYNRCGFTERGRTGAPGQEVVFLGVPLTPA